MPRHLHYITLDVFTVEPFTGNPLAIVFLPEDKSSISQSQKQLIAREFNFSETIFVHSHDGSSVAMRRIDIFTMDEELPFAGHPTIGAASWFLRHSSKKQDQGVEIIKTKSGEIPIFRSPDGVSIMARIAHHVRIHAGRFPFSELLRLHPSLASFLDDDLKSDRKKNGFPIVSIVKGMTQIHVELPNLAALAAVTFATGGEMVPARSSYLDDGWAGDGLVVIYFFVRNVDDAVTGKKVIRTRMLLGNAEDPATGSAASGLAAYLSLTDRDLLEKKGAEFEIVQGVEMGRRSDIGVGVVLSKDGQGIESVELKGSAVKISEGDILVQ